MIVFSHWESQEAFGSDVPPAFLFFLQCLFLIIHFLIQHCILSISLHIIIGSRNEYVFLPIFFNCLHQIKIHQAGTQGYF